jgi:hypothetical protein
MVTIPYIPQGAGVMSPQGVFGNTNINSTSVYHALRIWCEDTTPIAAVEVGFSGNTGSPTSTINCVLVADDGTGRPDGTTDVGGGSPTLKAFTPTVNSINKITLTNAYVPTAGQWLWVLFYPNAGTLDTSNFYRIMTDMSGFGAWSGDNIIYRSTDSGSTWAEDASGFVGLSVLDSSDNYLLQPSAAAGPSTGGAFAFDSADNPDEHACCFDVPDGAQATVVGVRIFTRGLAAGASIDLKVYDDTTEKASRSIEYDELLEAFANNQASYLRVSNASPIIGPTTGRVSMQSTHPTSRVYCTNAEFGSQARREGSLLFQNIWAASRTGFSGAFTEHLDRVVSIFPLIEWEVATGGSGGSTLVMQNNSGRFGVK